jgi:flagellar basal body-associated protein FliL
MDDDAEIANPPSRLKTLLPFVGVLLVGVGGGYGASLAMAGSAEAAEGVADESAPEEAEEGTAEGGHGEAASPGHGSPAPAHGSEGKAAVSAGMKGGSVVTNLGTFTVNLRGSGGGRVLRMEVQVDASSASSGTVSERSAQLRDSIITGVSDYTWAELEGVDGKTRLRDELLDRVNGVVAPAAVDRVYFTQFVVQ